MMELIKVTDKMPELMVNVLAYRPGVGFRVECYGISKWADPGETEKWSFDRSYPNAPVTHWMPLPKPPKQVIA